MSRVTGLLPAHTHHSFHSWDGAYAGELANFAHNGDEGEVWFGEDSLHRVLDWFGRRAVPKAARVLDVGCGNGVTCVHLAAEGYVDVTGVDYAEAAVELARAVARKRDATLLRFEVRD